MGENKDFENTLTKAEEKWLKILYHEVKSQFNRYPLPSHDHTHHYRVWFYAKELLRTLSDAGFVIDNAMIEKAIISAFFHDTGMTVTRDPSHGIESRLICEKFLRQHAGLNRSDVDEILEAIEKHDDKAYAQRMKGINNYTILAVADDLDAYGAIGIYRYYEIYLLRGISKEEIPLKVIDNIGKRFSFLERIFGSIPTFIEKHFIRKQFTINYFNQFIQKDSTVDSEMLSLHMGFLDRLMKRAYQFNNGLDFLKDDNTITSSENEDLHTLISVLKKEVRLFKFDF